MKTSYTLIVCFHPLVYNRFLYNDWLWVPLWRSGNRSPTDYEVRSSISGEGTGFLNYCVTLYSTQTAREKIGETFKISCVRPWVSR